MGLSNIAVDSAIYNSVGAMGVGYPPQPPVINTGYMPGAEWEPNTYGFKVVKVENGWTMAIGGKQWICQTPQELADRMVAILVEERLNK